MDKVRRFDIINLDARGAVRLDNGFLKAPMTLTRVGVFKYRNADGSERRELRLPEEVFSKESMASFELVPFLDEHPYAEGGAVTSENAKRLQAGSVGGVHQAGTNLDGTVMVSDESVVGKVLSGKTAVSCGYLCDREMTPGIWTDSAGVQHPYDLIQRNIRGNHVALVQAGRAGPEARIRLDAHDAVLVANQPTHKEEKPNMEKLTLDGITIEVPGTAAQVINRFMATSNEALSAARKDATEARAQLTSTKAELDKTKGALDAQAAELAQAKDPKRRAAEVAERVALETAARKHLGADFKLDGLDARGVKAAVLAKLAPSLSLDGKTDDYIAGQYDYVMANAPKGNPATALVAAQVRAGHSPTVVQDSADDDVNAPFKAMQNSFNNPQAAKN